MMDSCKLSPTGPALSRLVYGTWRILDEDSKPTADQLAQRFEACLELGIDTLDTAEIYGNYGVEAAIGSALRDRNQLKSRLKFITKAGIDIPSTEKAFARLPHYNATAKNLIACAEKSLQLLGIEAIDVFLVHRPDWLTPADETAKGLNRLVQEGKILHAGVSNYTPSQFQLLNSRLERPLVTNQVEISLMHMDCLYDGTLDQCQERGILPMAWSPLGGGRLFNPHHEPAMRIRAAMDAMRERYDNAPDEALALAWVLAHPSQPVGIIGTNKLERIQTTARAADVRLDRQDWYTLWEAAQGRSVP